VIAPEKRSVIIMGYVVVSFKKRIPPLQAGSFASTSTSTIETF